MDRNGRGATIFEDQGQTSPDKPIRNYIDIPINITKYIPKDPKARQTKQQISPDPVKRPNRKINRSRNAGRPNQMNQNAAKESIITTHGAQEQQRKSSKPGKLTIGDRSNLDKEEPILIQLSTAEIKSSDFDPFQADDTIEIPPCLFFS